MRVNFETVMKWFGIGALTVVIAVILTFMLADKRVNGYYATRDGASTGFGGTCVYASAPWYPDDKAFCTEDINKAIEVTRQLNESVR